MLTYKEIKARELRWLKQQLPFLESPSSFDVFETKFQLMRELHAETLKHLNNPVTLIRPLKHALPHTEITFRYQRQDLQIAPHALETFYPGLKTSLPVTGYFTRSGQSATFGLLLALKNSSQNFSLRPLNKMIYFETKKAVSGLGIPFHHQSQSALLDSCTSEEGPLKILEKEDIKELVVDTTNWSLGSSELQSIIDWAQEKNVRLHFIRSHLKLDSLGAEYGLLGSVVTMENGLTDGWSKHLIESLSYAGLIASLDQIYPFLWDSEFLALTKERTERIRKNTQALTAELKKFLPQLKNSVRLVEYQHGLYFMVLHPGKSPHFEDKFLKLAYLHEVEARYCDSFGFDFLSLTNVLSYYENTGESALRFCPGDNEEKIHDVLQVIKDYLSFFDQQISQRP